MAINSVEPALTLSGKHFINHTDDLVVRLLRSLLVHDNSLRLIPERKGTLLSGSSPISMY